VAPPRTYNLADLYEAVADEVPHRIALITPERTLTYAQLEERANRLANHWAAEGVGPGDHVGCYLYNGTEYVEGMLAAFKLRAVPINVNYRYVADELQYLFNDAGLVAVLHEPEFLDRMPAVRSTLARGDDYEAALAASTPDRPAAERSEDDHYIVYTGGTTGMPKGVVWRHEDAFYACFGGGDYMRRNPIKAPEELLERLLGEEPLVYFPIAPMMHGAAQWTVFGWFFAGGTAMLSTSRPSTDYAEVWQLITDHKANIVTIIGDAVARPLIDEYKANADRYDPSSIFSFGSGAVPLSQTGRDELNATFPTAMVMDGYGSSETGAQAGNVGPGRFEAYDDETAVLDPETLAPVAAGSGAEGRVARRGHIPLRYHNDPEKTAATFVERDGVRWVLTGDVATVLEDGSIQLFGRGSMCINTGGEKVFPEEVESTLVGHPDVYDALVVGVADDRWGERVTAVVSLVDGSGAGEADLVEHCRTRLAGFKVPRSYVFVDAVQRSPAGKADYKWAKQVAEQATEQVTEQAGGEADA
jgi:acyl-CoA synthetase (AMP-forming)/AMP-acid ligase II